MDAVFSVALSSDGRRIASGSADNTVRVWNAATGEVMNGPFKGHTDHVQAVVFSLDGKRVISGSRDGTIRVWDIESGETIVRPITNSGGSINSFDLSPDGRHIVSGAMGTSISLWDAATGEPIGEPLIGHGNIIRSVTYSHDGKYIACGLHNLARNSTVIQLWNAASGTSFKYVPAHTDKIYSLAFSLDGELLASASRDKTVLVWDVKTGGIVSSPSTQQPCPESSFLSNRKTYCVWLRRSRYSDMGCIYG